ncbi:MAG: hypothetical protein LBV04_02190, partial [Deferribacteraceae bacterium]|nr:hypothetical protein [Deferribacteraceae bacterium]
CAQDVDEEAIDNCEMILMPITNSPRSGECAYDGELDMWKFDPDKPFPQPQQKKVRRYKRVQEG